MRIGDIPRRAGTILHASLTIALIFLGGDFRSLVRNRQSCALGILLLDHRFEGGSIVRLPSSGQDPWKWLPRVNDHPHFKLQASTHPSYSARRLCLFLLIAVFASLSCPRHPELLLLLQHHLPQTCFPSHAPPNPRRPLLIYAIPCRKLATDAEVILMLLIKPVSGEAEAGETLSGWMRVLAMEIMRGCVFLFISWTTALMALIDTCHMCGGSAGTASPCVAFWQCYHVLATDGDTGSAPACVSSHSLSLPSSTRDASYRLALTATLLPSHPQPF